MQRSRKVSCEWSPGILDDGAFSLSREATAEANHLMFDGREEPRTHCIRCGTCCMKGGPSLHLDDTPLFADAILKIAHVYTLRKGETVRNIDDALMTLEHEIIKIKGQGETWTCMFYDDDQSGCKIYEHRPIECRALKCWDVREFKGVMARPYLQRRDLLNPGDGILKIIDAHEQRCAYDTLHSAAQELCRPDSEKAAEKTLDLLKYDNHMRPLLADKLNMTPSDMDFFFGRPLTTTIRMFGLCVEQEGDTFMLKPMDSKRRS